MLRRRFIRPDGSRTLVIKREEKASALAAVAAVVAEEGRIERLVIGTTTWDNLEFLSEYAQRIKMLSVDGWSTESSLGLEHFTQLEELHLEGTPKPLLNLMLFQELVRCHLDWHAKYPKGFFTLPKLRHLDLSDYSGTSCEAIVQAKNLTDLHLFKAKIQHLNGLEVLANLSKLSLLNCKSLEDLTALALLPQLEVLHLHSCPKIAHELDFIGQIASLRELEVHECGGPGFVSLQCLASLPQLEKVLLGPVQTLDWNWVFSHPTLRDVTVRAHVGYKLEDEALFACAQAHGRVLTDYRHVEQKNKAPWFGFNMSPIAGA